VVGGGIVKAPELEAVVRVGDHCSGVLIRADTVLTSAHCLGVGSVQIRIGETEVTAPECHAHPRYEPGNAAHDIGFCRLVVPSQARVAPLADWGLVVDSPVTLAGYGRSAPFARDSSVLRRVDTTVASVGVEGFEVGTRERTACIGDSGGPVLVARGDGFLVVGIIHGTNGAICASAAQAVPIALHRPWLDEALEGPASIANMPWIVVSAFSTAAVAGAVRAWRRRRGG
jgi:secreted trypsin-like serine protease